MPIEPGAILALLANLQTQIAALSAENEQLRAALTQYVPQATEPA